jgi:hypothetical protein
VGHGYEERVAFVLHGQMDICRRQLLRFGCGHRQEKTS